MVRASADIFVIKTKYASGIESAGVPDRVIIFTSALGDAIYGAGTQLTLTLSPYVNWLDLGGRAIDPCIGTGCQGAAFPIYVCKMEDRGDLVVLEYADFGETYGCWCISIYEGNESVLGVPWTRPRKVVLRSARLPQCISPLAFCTFVDVTSIGMLLGPWLWSTGRGGSYCDT